MADEQTKSISHLSGGREDWRGRLRQIAEFANERARQWDYAALSRDLFKVAEELESLLTSAPPQEQIMAELCTTSDWCPIETAPRDGTKILAVVQRDDRQWILVVRALDRADGWYTDPGKHHVNATHWMPLPAPPPESAPIRSEQEPAPQTDSDQIRQILAADMTVQPSHAPLPEPREALGPVALAVYGLVQEVRQLRRDDE